MIHQTISTEKVVSNFVTDNGQIVRFVHGDNGTVKRMCMYPTMVEGDYYFNYRNGEGFQVYKMGPHKPIYKGFFKGEKKTDFIMDFLNKVS